MNFDFILNALLIVFALIGVAIGFHRGLFDQLLSWAIILVSFLTPFWISNAVYANNVQSGTLTNLGRGIRLNITGTPIEHFINSKFLVDSGYATAQDWANGAIGYVIFLLILVVVGVVLSIVGLHFAGHYIKKYRNLRKNFRIFDTVGGGVFGIVNAYVVWLVVSTVVSSVTDLMGNVGIM